jgi:hypothetical protein
MSHSVSKFLSVIAHPIFINLLCLYSLFYLFPQLSHGIPNKMQVYLIFYIFISTSIVPLLIVLLLKAIGKIDSIFLKDKSDRNLPYLFTFCMYIFTFYNFQKTSIISPILLNYLLGCSFIILFILLINQFNKISIHLATLGGLCGIIGSVGFLGYLEIRFLLMISFIFSGIIASARINLGAHTPQQVNMGFVLGFFVMFVAFNFVSF